MTEMASVITYDSFALNERLSEPIAAESVVEVVILERQIVGLNALVPISECDIKRRK